MRNLKLCILLALLSLGEIALGQNVKPAPQNGIDTVNVDGYFITYLQRPKNRFSSGWFRGSMFLMDNTYGEWVGKKGHETLKALKRLEERQNVGFFIDDGWVHNHFAEKAFFNTHFPSWKPSQRFFPRGADYSFKDKNIHFKCTAVRVRCLRAFIPVEQLRDYGQFPGYSFDLDRVPVYLVLGVVP